MQLLCHTPNAVNPPEPDPFAMSPPRNPERDSSWYIAHNSPEVALTIHEGEVSTEPLYGGIPGKRPPRRVHGDIHTFSKKSRIRLLRVMHQLNTPNLSNPAFITLTARHWRKTPEEFRDCFLNGFLPKLKYFFGPIAYIWRLEPHKSGYPHIHLMVWAYKSGQKLTSKCRVEAAKRYWWELIEDTSPAAQKHSCEIKQCDSRRMVMSYVAKYCAKEDGGRGLSITGRRWGRSHNLSTAPIFRCKITAAQHVALKEAAIRLLETRGKWGKRNVEYLPEAREWWLWLETDEILQILDEADCYRAWGKLKLYRSLYAGQLGYVEKKHRP